MNERDQRAGFTLMEIMIVVAIIGLMALIAIPSWTAARTRSMLTVCAHNQDMIFEQMNIYCLEHNKTCDTTVFPNLCAVRDALVPLTGAERYIKRRNVFACPANAATEEHDYRFVRDGYKIIDIECDHTDEHND